MVGSLALSFMLSDISMLLFMLILIAGIVLLFSVKLTDNPYRKLWKEPLLFDKTVKAELNTVYAEKKKFLQLFNCLNCIGLSVFTLNCSGRITLCRYDCFSCGNDCCRNWNIFMYLYVWPCSCLSAIDYE